MPTCSNSLKSIEYITGSAYSLILLYRIGINVFHIKWGCTLIYYLINVIFPIGSGVFPDYIS